MKRSEANLKAQYDKIIGEEKPQAVRQCLDKARMDAFISASTALSVNPEEFFGAIQPLIEICTKENIAKGKNWAVELMSRGEAYANLVVNYLLLRAQNMDASFETRLHIVYLINDLLHFLKRHSDVAHFQSALNRIVVPVYSLALEMADEEKKVKLTRVLSLWETNAYLPDDILKNMKEEGIREAFMKEWKVDQDKVRVSILVVLSFLLDTRREDCRGGGRAHNSLRGTEEAARRLRRSRTQDVSGSGRVGTFGRWTPTFSRFFSIWAASATPTRLWWWQ